MKNLLEKFSIKDKTCIITGGAGLLGLQHAKAVLEGEGVPVLLDISEEALQRAKNLLSEEYPNNEISIYKVDITNESELEKTRENLLKEYGHIDILINNAANNPKMEKKVL